MAYHIQHNWDFIPNPISTWRDNMANRSRKKKIDFWVNEEEKDLIDFKIKNSNLPKGEFLRRMVIDGKVEIRNIEFERKKLDTRIALVTEINKIGTNINQVAKHVNQVGNIREDDFKYLNERMEEIWQLLKSTLYGH
jgi:hypothetical protein